MKFLTALRLKGWNNKIKKQKIQIFNIAKNKLLEKLIEKQNSQNRKSQIFL